MWSRWNILIDLTRDVSYEKWWAYCILLSSREWAPQQKFQTCGEIRLAIYFHCRKTYQIKVNIKHYMGILYFNKATLKSCSIFLFELNQNTTGGSHGIMLTFWFYPLVSQWVSRTALKAWVVVFSCRRHNGRDILTFWGRNFYFIAFIAWERER